MQYYTKKRKKKSRFPFLVIGIVVFLIVIFSWLWASYSANITYKSGTKIEISK